MWDKVKEFVKKYFKEDSFGDKIAAMIGETASDEDVDKAFDAIVAIFANAEEQLADGKDLSDIYKILAVSVEELVELAEDISGPGSGKTKKDFVVASATALYAFVDKGPDGDLNRVDIPWVPQGIENVIEGHVLPFILDFVIETAVAAINKRK